MKEQQNIHLALEVKVDALSEIALKQEAEIKKYSETVSAHSVEIAELSEVNRKLADRFDAILKVIEKLDKKIQSRTLILSGGLVLTCILALGLRFF